MLPTEALFEEDARGGLDGLAYPLGDVFDHSQLWCSKAEIGFMDRLARSTGHRMTFGACGLSDMTGIVWQWRLDVYSPYTSTSLVDPSG